MIAGGGVRPFKSFAILDENARLQPPAPGIFLPRGRKCPAKRGENFFVPAVEARAFRAVQIPEAVVDQNAARPRGGSERGAVPQVFFKILRLVGLERMQTDMDLVQARRVQQCVLLFFQQRSVRGHDHTEAKPRSDIQQLSQLRMQQRFAHNVQIEIVRMGSELSSQQREFLRREHPRGALRPGAERAAPVADIRDLQIDA